MGNDSCGNVSNVTVGGQYFDLLKNRIGSVRNLKTIAFLDEVTSIKITRNLGTQ